MASAPRCTPAIRAITTPGFHEVMGVLTLPGVRHVGIAGHARALAPWAGSRPATSTRSPRSFDTFKDPAARHAIRHVVRAVVDWRGQIVTMADRAYLTEEMPMWVVWGRDDRVIPVRHASHAARFAPSARGRGDPRRRALPAQGPPAPVQPDRPRLHPHDRAGEVLRGRGSARC